MSFKIKIIYFASIKDLLKKDFDDVELLDNSEYDYDSNKIFNLIEQNNIQKSKELCDLLKNCLLAIDDEFINKDQIFKLKNNDIISILPPISAG